MYDDLDLRVGCATACGAWKRFFFSNCLKGKGSQKRTQIDGMQTETLETLLASNTKEEVANCNSLRILFNTFFKCFKCFILPALQVAPTCVATAPAHRPAVSSPAPARARSTSHSLPPTSSWWAPRAGEALKPCVCCRARQDPPSCRGAG